MKIKDMKRTGLFAEHASGIAPIRYGQLRMTIPVREALEAAGSTVGRDGEDWSVTLGDTMPAGIIATRTVGDSRLSLRMENEPEWPGEIGHAYWEQVDFTPCEKCGAPLVWYEAGYAPGYRVCAKRPHHHMQAQ